MNIGSVKSVGNIKSNKLVCVYSTILTAATTSLSITGLNGDIDYLYYLVCKVKGNGSYPTLSIRPNNDSSAVYAYQNMRIYGGTREAVRGSGLTIFAAAYAHTTDAYFDCLIYAKKSGYLRPILDRQTEGLGANIYGQDHFHGIWGNTADIMTSLTILSGVANAFGIGTSIELYSLRKK
jgi:hypothetical protein